MPLTVEQQTALEALLAQVPAARPARRPPPDLLKTWLGFSRADLKQWLTQNGLTKDGLEQRILDWAEQNPLDAVFEFVALTALAFYWAEREANPKIKTYLDSFYYIATCVSVGYADIFAVTQAGRSIAALVMLVGPAMAARSLNRPVLPGAPPPANNG